MTQLTRIKVLNQDGKVVHSLRFRDLVTFQSNEEGDGLRYIAMSWKGKHAKWAKRHLETPARSEYLILCYGTTRHILKDREIGRFRVQLCNTYRLKKKLGGALYASLVIVAEDQFEKLKAFA